MYQINGQYYFEWNSFYSLSFIALQKMLQMAIQPKVSETLRGPLASDDTISSFFKTRILKEY